jgi:glycosyl-4,4'-diaponeurosporenoate acyltransferase
MFPAILKYDTLNLRQQILLYFKPKKFEFFRDKIIYELIGIKTYKKYLPTTGDIVRKRMKITQIKISKTDKINELYEYEKKTRNYEWRHIIGIIIFVLLTFMLNRKLTVFDWFFLPILNLYVNIYPIFLQRYNRIRIIRVLQNNGIPSPYESIDRKNIDE